MKLVFLFCAVVALASAKSPMSLNNDLIFTDNLSMNSTEIVKFALLNFQGFSNGFFGSEVGNMKLCINETVTQSLKTWDLIQTLTNSTSD